MNLDNYELEQQESPAATLKIVEKKVGGVS
jgi:hypothetical protein